MAKKKQVKPVGNVKIADEAVALAKYATKAYIDAGERGIKKKTVEQFPLDGDERATLRSVTVPLTCHRADSSQQIISLLKAVAIVSLSG